MNKQVLAVTVISLLLSVSSSHASNEGPELTCNGLETTIMTLAHQTEYRESEAERLEQEIAEQKDKLIIAKEHQRKVMAEEDSFFESGISKIDRSARKAIAKSDVVTTELLLTTKEVRYKSEQDRIKNLHKSLGYLKYLKYQACE